MDHQADYRGTCASRRKVKMWLWSLYSLSCLAVHQCLVKALQQIVHIPKVSWVAIAQQLDARPWRKLLYQYLFKGIESFVLHFLRCILCDAGCWLCFFFCILEGTFMVQGRGKRKLVPVNDGLPQAFTWNVHSCSSNEHLPLCIIVQVFFCKAIASYFMFFVPFTTSTCT